MPANQFFTDWVTGDIITAAKLNQMKNNVQPYLGYTPVNKAGDSMTGPLTLSNGGETLSLKPGSQDHTYIGLYARTATPNTRSAYIGFPNIGSTDLTLYNETGGDVFITSSGTDATIRLLRNTSVTGNLSVSGSILGRYDHQNRFVFSSNSGFSNSLAAGNVLYLAIFPVYIPSGKSLYLRRARYYLSNPNLRLQVGGTSTFTSNNNNDDVTPNVIMSSTSGLGSVSVLIYNPTGSTQNMFPSDSCWLEFEIV